MGETTAISADMFTGLISSMTDQITPATIIGVIVAVLGATVAFAFMWWGANYIKAKIMGAIKRGRA